MKIDLPASWRRAVGDELESSYFRKLKEFVDEERRTQTVYPPEDEVFNALKYTPFDKASVLVLGQDPYHGRNQAHGLAFSVRPGVRPPPSLRNIFQELHDDLGCKVPNNGSLIPWAEQGVLLLNAVLTVRAGKPNSHKNKGWELFTDEIIRKVSAKPDPAVFVLWGAYALKKLALIDTGRHAVITSVHPSPYSADKGFFGSRPFSTVNKHLTAAGKPEVDWQIPDL